MTRDVVFEPLHEHGVGVFQGQAGDLEADHGPVGGVEVQQGVDFGVAGRPGVDGQDPPPGLGSPSG